MYLENVRKFVKYFCRGRKLKLAGLFCLSFFAGCLEFLGIALIYPFIVMLINPDIVTSSNLYIKWSSFCGISDSTINALLLGLLALMLFVMKNVYMICFLYIQSKFLNKWKLDISKMFMEYYLFADYDKVMNMSCADKTYVLSALPYQVMSTFLVRILNLGTSSIIVLMVLSLILLKFPQAGFVTILFVSASMFLQNKYFKSKTKNINAVINEKAIVINRLIYEYMNNLKEVKILSAESVFFDNYKRKSEELNRLNINCDYYVSIPPYIVEVLIVLALMIMAALISVGSINNQSSMIASFALVVAAIFRIAPSLNRIQSSIINIGIGRTFVKAILDECEKCDLINFSAVGHDNFSTLLFNDKIELKNISYSYNTSTPVLKNINLTINKGDFIGIIGLSGAGKSTLADILTGLLTPSDGEILIDGKILTKENLIAYRKLLGYVPQEINVLQTSIRENVAWGIPADEIDDARVIHALIDAQLNDFMKNFEDGIYAKPFVDSKGISQGQKQRIAIARALYRNPLIVILDEATSSLDVKIEHEITDMLNDLKKDKTIIAIAHRLSTLKSCNKLVYLKDGEIVDIGTFDELSSKYEDFENLVKLSAIN